MRIAPSLSWRALAVIAVAVVLAGGTAIMWLPRSKPVPPNRIDTVAYRLDVDRWRLPAGTRRPSIDVAGDALVLASNDGTLHVAERPGPGRDAPISWQRLPFAIPTDLDVFLERDSKWGFGFAIRDIFVDRRPDGTYDLYALYGVHVSEHDCIVTRVGRFTNFLGKGADAEPEVLFETKPCLPITGPVDRIGGRLAVRDRSLFVTIGTPTNDNPPRDREIGDPDQEWAQQSDNPFGKLVQIDLDTNTAVHLTAGHRNPQGLFLAKDGRIWETEHGPKGGDELNVIRAGANYGWPVVTYGTSYAGFTWPPSTQQGRHAGFERPTYAWVPSVGISQLVGLEEPGYGRWQDDLLVLSLNGNTVFRVRIEDDRAIFAEPIRLGHRLRDIVAVDAVVYIVTDYDLLLRLSPEYGLD